MFHQNRLRQVWDDLRRDPALEAAFEAMAELRDVLGYLREKRFYRLDAAIDCVRLAVLSGEPMILVGPPGVAKSMLLRDFCALAGVDVTSPEYFDYLLTPYTEPSELFGYIDIAKLMNADAPSLERLDDLAIQRAEVVFLDEVFNASSAILNALLTFMNERVFHDRGKTVNVAAEHIFAATNQTPQEPTLRAFFDRFLLRGWLQERHEVGQNTGEDMFELLSRGFRASSITGGAALWRDFNAWRGTDHRRPRRNILKDLARFRSALRDAIARDRLPFDPEADAFFRAMAQIAQDVAGLNMTPLSNRRLLRMSFVMLTNAIYRVATGERELERIGPNADDLSILVSYGLDRSIEGDDSVSRAMQKRLYDVGLDFGAA